MSTQENKIKLEKLMHEATGNPLDVYEVIYQEFLKNDDRPFELLRTVIEFPYAIGNEDSPSEKISDDMKHETVNQYGKWLQDTVNLLSKPNDLTEIF